MEREELQAAQQLVEQQRGSQQTALSSASAGHDAMVKAVRRKAATLRASYASLLQSAAASHRLLASSFRSASPPSVMSPQLAVMERVWHSVCRHSTPTQQQLSIMVTAYGKEARRLRISDLYHRWQDDREQHERSRETPTQRQEREQREQRLLAGLSEEEQQALRRRESRTRAARLRREAAAGFPSSRPLFPAIPALDTVAYNSIIAAYTATLPLSRLSSTSPQLAFPLSLLPRFRPDAATFSCLMSLHCAMRETGRVLQLYEELKAQRAADSALRGGSREPQELRRRRKEERQYVQAVLLRALAQAGEVQAAEAVWAELQRQQAAGELELSRVLYHAMLEVYATANQHERLRSVAVEMRRRGLPMDRHSVCTVVRAMCRAGHLQDAVMLHQRLQHGSLGPAAAHRSSYLCLLSQLADQPSVPFTTVLSVFAAGMDSGLLRSPDAHRHRWLVDLRCVPLSLVPVALEFHLRSMLTAFMQSWRTGGRQAALQSVPRRGLLVLLSRSRREQEAEERREMRLLSPQQDDDSAQWQPHALSASAIDPDELPLSGEEESGELEADEAEQERASGSGSDAGVLLDVFASAAEQSLLSRLQSLRVEGSYVQRWVRHLLSREWPALDAHFTPAQQHAEQKEQTSPAAALDASSPQRLRLSHSSSSLLRIPHRSVLFWLLCRAHLTDPAVFPSPPVHGSSERWLARLQAGTQQQQRDRAGGEGKDGKEAAKEERASSAAASRPLSLEEQLSQYKREEREALRLKARVFRTGRPPRAEQTQTLQQQEEHAADEARSISHKKQPQFSSASTAEREEPSPTSRAAAPARAPAASSLLAPSTLTALLQPPSVSTSSSSSSASPQWTAGTMAALRSMADRAQQQQRHQTVSRSARPRPAAAASSGTQRSSASPSSTTAGARRLRLRHAGAGAA